MVMYFLMKNRSAVIWFAWLFLCLHPAKPQNLPTDTHTLVLSLTCRNLPGFLWLGRFPYSNVEDLEASFYFYSHKIIWSSKLWMLGISSSCWLRVCSQWAFLSKISNLQVGRFRALFFGDTRILGCLRLLSESKSWSIVFSRDFRSYSYLYPPPLLPAPNQYSGFMTNWKKKTLYQVDGDENVSFIT